MTVKNIKAYIALLVVCIVWGTTFPAMRIGVKTFPPLLFAGMRHTIAGILVFTLLLFTRKRNSRVSVREVFFHCLLGILMHTLSNGVIVWALQYIPGGLAALIAAIMPVYVVLINLATSTARKSINPLIGAGLLSGSLGVILIFRDQLIYITDYRYLMGIIAVFLASLSWTTGSLLMKSFSSSFNPVTGMAIQLCSGGIILLSASMATENLSAIKSVSFSGIAALAYLVIFGSLLTYLCYIYAVKKLPVGLVSVYAYINPFVAIVIGYVWLHETVTWITISAFVTTLSGVYFVNRGYRRLQEQ